MRAGGGCEVDCSDRERVSEGTPEVRGVSLPN